MIDIHAHILPGVDDGAVDLAEAITMGRQAYLDGTRYICCTSHLNADENAIETLCERDKLRESLQRVFYSQGINVTLLGGAEWMVSPELIDILCQSPLATLGKSRAFLFEMSRYSPCAFLHEFVKIAVAEGFQPIFAHPERYPSITAYNFDSVLAPIVQAGAKLQLTASSLTGNFGRPVETIALLIAKRFSTNLLIASDTHDSVHRKPGLSEGLNVINKTHPNLDALILKQTQSLLNVPYPSRTVTK